MPAIVSVTTTVGSAEQAQQLADRLLQARLAGCVQIDGPLRSLYRWQGAVCNEIEYRLTCKTLPPWGDALLVELRQAHPYELPQLLSCPCEASAEYAAWLRQQLRPESE